MSAGSFVFPAYGSAGPTSTVDYQNEWFAKFGNAVLGAFQSGLGGSPPTINESGTPHYTGGQGVSYTFSFSDTLQSTYPVTIAVSMLSIINDDYSYPNNWSVQVSAGTNSSSPVIFFTNSVTIVPTGGSGGSWTGGQNGYWSGASNRFCLALGEGPDIKAQNFINIERTKNTSGADTSDGVIVQATNGANVSSGPRYVSTPVTSLPNAGGVQSGNVNMVLPFSGARGTYQQQFNTPLNTARRTAAAGSIIGISPVVPFCFRPYNPGLGMVLYYGTDFTPYATQSITMQDGSAHTYLPLQNTEGYFDNSGGRTHILMRYE